MRQLDKQNPWELDFIDKMFIFSDINDSSKFNPKSFNMTFQLASFSIHTSVRIYSERIDALYNFTMGFLTGLRTEKGGDIHVKEKYLPGKKKKEKSKPFLAIWKFSNSKRNFFTWAKSTKFISSNEMFPQKNYLLEFQLKRSFLVQSTNYSKLIHFSSRLTNQGEFNRLSNFSFLISNYDFRINLQTQKARSFLIRETQNPFLFFKRFPDYAKNRNEKPDPFGKKQNLSPFQVFPKCRSFQLGESLEKNIEKKNSHIAPKKDSIKKTLARKIKKIGLWKNTDVSFFLFNKKEKKLGKQEFLNRYHSTDKVLEIPGIFNWVLKKKSKKNFLDHDFKKIQEYIDLPSIEKENFLKAPQKKNYPPPNKHYWGNQKEMKLLGLEKTKFREASEQKNFQSNFFHSFPVYPRIVFKGLEFKNRPKKCFFTLENFKETEIILKASLTYREINVTKFLLFFLQAASENKILYLGDIDLNKIFFLSHKWVYSSNGRVSA